MKTPNNLKYILVLLTGLVCSDLEAASSGYNKQDVKNWDYIKQTKIHWREYGEAAFIEAKEKNKPLYIFIYSNECGWCKKFETETLEKFAVREILQDKFIPVSINQLKQPKLTVRLGVKVVPANIIVTPARQRLSRFYGFLTVQALTDALNRILASWEKGELPDEEFGDESTCCPVNVKE